METKLQVVLTVIAIHAVMTLITRLVVIIIAVVIIVIMVTALCLYDSSFSNKSNNHDAMVAILVRMTTIRMVSYRIPDIPTSESPSSTKAQSQ